MKQGLHSSNLLSCKQHLDIFCNRWQKMRIDHITKCERCTYVNQNFQSIITLSFCVVVCVSPSALIALLLLYVQEVVAQFIYLLTIFVFVCLFVFIATYYIKLVTTSWAYSMYIYLFIYLSCLYSFP